MNYNAVLTSDGKKISNLFFNLGKEKLKALDSEEETNGDDTEIVCQLNFSKH